MRKRRWSKRLAVTMIAVLLACMASPCAVVYAEESQGDAFIEQEEEGVFEDAAAVEAAFGEETESVPAEEEVVSEDAQYANGFPKQLLNRNGIVVTATGVSQDSYYYYLNLTIQNNSTQGIIVQPRRSAINGLMVDSMMSANVAPGKTAIDQLYFHLDDLEFNGIETVGTIDYDIHIANSETYENLMDDTPVSVTVHTGITQPFNSGKQVLYNNNGIRIALLGLQDQSGKSYVSDENIILSIENNTGKAVYIQTRDTSVNDIMIDPIISEELRPGHKSYALMRFFKSDLESKGISTINKVETRFHIFDAKNWSDYSTSEPITFYPVLFPTTAGGTGSSSNTELPPVTPPPAVSAEVIPTSPNNEKGAWMQQDGGWWFSYSNGGYPANKWEYIKGVWYRFDGAGWMQTGWVDDNGTWYYMDPSSGAMQTGWLKYGVDWYYLYPSSGAMATGWVDDNGTWYYMNSSGAMAIGWVDDGGTWYYMNPSGAMATGWVDDNGIWYYMRSSGAMVTGWVQSGGIWYFMDDSGAMLANTSRSIDGKTYYFDRSGACTNP